MRALADLLPEYKETGIRTEADYYGASGVVANMLGRASAPRSFSYWQHGWIDTGVLVHPREVAFFGGPRDRRMVASQRVVAFLRSHGYSNVFATGLPLIYESAPDVQRIPSSLLVMPAHSLPYMKNGWSQDEYGEQIRELCKHFRTVVACVHSSCVEGGYWVRQFDKLGIQWVSGAKVADRNSLRRMRCLFASFETMTTNALGSHVLYAAYSGCRVSIYGAYASFRKEDFARDPYYTRYPDLLDNAVATSQEEHVRSRYPDLFRHPAEAMDKSAWAEEEMGASCRRSPEDLADLLGWSIGDQVRGYGKLVTQTLRRGFQTWRQKGGMAGLRDVVNRVSSRRSG